MPSPQLDGKIAVITGAGQGIGEGIAERLAADGATVVVLDVNAEAAAKVAARINSSGSHAMGLGVDVGKRDAVIEALVKVNNSLGPPDILVNNAGIYTSSPLTEVTEEEWQRTINVNLSGVFFCSQAVAPHLIEKRYGRIINISSTGGKIGWPRNHAYCASKAGVIGLTRVLALDLAPYNVTVNAVCPGNTNTAMLKVVDENICRTEGLERGSFLLEQLTRIPLGRYAEPADIAALVSFLSSRDASYITGQAINADGGIVMY